MKKIMEFIKDWFLYPFEDEATFWSILLWLAMTWLLIITGSFVTVVIVVAIAAVVLNIPWIIPVIAIPLIISLIIHLYDKKFHNVLDNQH